MTKRFTTLLGFALLTCVVYGSPNDGKYAKFRALFDNYFDENKQKREIPKSIYGDYISDFTGNNEHKYALGVIENHQGLDLFFILSEYSYVGTSEEGLYANKAKSSIDMIAVKDGLPYNGDSSSSDNDETLVRYSTLYSQYSIDESVDYTMNYSVNADTTINLYLQCTEYSNMTGLEYPITREIDVKYHIDEEAQFVDDEILRVKFSTPFLRLTAEDIKNLTAYPTEDNPYNLLGGNDNLNLSLFFPEFDLFFYYNSEFQPGVKYVEADGAFTKEFIFSFPLTQEEMIETPQGLKFVIGQ